MEAHALLQLGLDLLCPLLSLVDPITLASSHSSQISKEIIIATKLAKWNTGWPVKMEFQIVINCKTCAPDTAQNYSNWRLFISYVNWRKHLVCYLSTYKFEEPLKRLENRPNASMNTGPVTGSRLKWCISSTTTPKTLWSSSVLCWVRLCDVIGLGWAGTCQRARLSSHFCFLPTLDPSIRTTPRSLKHRSSDQNIPTFAMSQSQYNVTSVLVLGTKPDPSAGIIMGLVSVQRMPAKSWANCVHERQRNNGDPRH